MPQPTRRTLLKTLLATPGLSIFARTSAAAPASAFQRVLDDAGSSHAGIGSAWESLNPGYWRTDGGRLRRVTRATGDRARNTGFPFHYESAANPHGFMPVDYDPSLPMGTVWNREWRLSGRYALRLRAVVRGTTLAPRPGDDPQWRMYRDDYGLFGLAFGGQTQFESFYPAVNAAPAALVFADGRYGLYRYADEDPVPLAPSAVGTTAPLREGDEVILQLGVTATGVTLDVVVNGSARERLHVPGLVPEGFFGVAARGLLDVEIDDVSIDPGANSRRHAPQNECHVCYPLGDSLREEDGTWWVRFVAICRTPGRELAIRVADTPEPDSGWAAVPVAGSAAIASSTFRRNTAIVTAALPYDPAERTMYYTVWKDGVDVTADPRPGTDSVGPGTGLIGEVPGGGAYVGRLPRLAPPYRLCGLSCHAIHTASRAAIAGSAGGHCGPRIVGAAEANTCGIAEPYYVHDQPCHGAFEHLEDFDYQILLWEDDIWYMELLLYPPSTDDAYKIVTTTLAGPTTRWQMMRHWNVLNPGDHDYGMDDVKGPEQILIRNRPDLGQDPEYMARNFQIVSHLMTGAENPSGTDNPKRWRKWKMPKRDFSLLIMDSRLWRTSQDPAIWDDEGWGADTELYTRTDPTRALLGEEQFAWLSRQLRTDAAPLICLTGINGLHTIWGGHLGDGWATALLDRDRVSADYAGWVKAGADRVLDLISARGGVVSVYGDVHAGCIVRNREKRVFESSFGPIGRWGGRSLIDGFGRQMRDFDGRPVEIVALYHHAYRDADLRPQEAVDYWNVLEAQFDPRPEDPRIALAIRNITDPPDAAPRGGGAVNVRAADTGRVPTALLPRFRTLANAELLFLDADGVPLRGAMTDASGRVALRGLVGPQPGDEVTVVARKGRRTATRVLRLLGEVPEPSGSR